MRNTRFRAVRRDSYFRTKKKPKNDRFNFGIAESKQRKIRKIGIKTISAVYRSICIRTNVPIGKCLTIYGTKISLYTTPTVQGFSLRCCKKKKKTRTHRQKNKKKNRVREEVYGYR